MRFRSAALFALFVAGFSYILWVGGCSEDRPTERTDRTVPTVSIVNPVETGVYGATIEDSATVVVTATDDDAIDHVELWCAFHEEPVARQIVSAAAPQGANRFTYFWSTASIPGGYAGSLYAVAVDRAGNRSSSPKIRVRIINKSQIGPPTADFIVAPAEGSVLTSFSFDPSVTADPLSEPVDILVRWDFEGDGTWDIDTTGGSNAAQIVRHTYAVPGTYNVTMEAYNRYYSIENRHPGVKVRPLIVRPAFGEPHPQMRMVRIDAGVYPFGALPCPTGGGCDQGDADETTNDTLRVRISTPFFIDAKEVTNELYTRFLNAATDSGNVIRYDDATGEVRAVDRDRVLLVLDPAVTRVKYQVIDSSFWVDQAYLEHPVTGVTWYGALSYASFYGLRLPTEVEWEIAARGQEIRVGFFYPWTPSNVIDGSYANYRQSGDPFELLGTSMSTTPDSSYDGTAIQGFPTRLAESPMGTYDQAGNVAEWVNDRYAADTYQILFDNYVRFGLPPIDPQGPDIGDARVLRGGSYTHWPWELRVTNRQEAEPFEKAPWIGFRTAYTEF
jgi:formylglycine-generating enzyme required for sulfatase activity